MTINGLSGLGGQYGGDVCPGVASAHWTVSVLVNPFDLAAGTHDVLERASGNTGYVVSLTVGALDDLNIQAAIGSTGATTTIASPDLHGWAAKWILITLHVADDDAVSIYANGNLVAQGSLPAAYAPAPAEDLTVDGANVGLFGGLGYIEEDISTQIQSHAFNVQQHQRLEIIGGPFGTVPPNAFFSYTNCWDGLSARNAGITQDGGLLNVIGDTWEPTPSGGSVNLTRLSGTTGVRILNTRGENFYTPTAGESA
jgi:hypothetical protein